MYKTESDARTAALALCKQDGLSNDAYVALFNKESDAFIIYPRVSTLAFKAAKTGSFAGKDCCIFIHDDKGKLVSAQTSIFRLVMDTVREFAGDEVYYDEYAKFDWHKEKPHMFMAKIALAVALRIGFADTLAGLITYEEAKCELEFKKSGGTTVKSSDFDITKPDLVIPPTDNIKQMVADIFGDAKPIDITIRDAKRDVGDIQSVAVK